MERVAPLTLGGARQAAPTRSRLLTGETIIAVVAVLGIGVHLVTRYLLLEPRAVYDWPLYVVLLTGGLPLLWELARKLVAFEFGSDLLAGVSIVTAALLGEYLVGSIVVLMLSGGTALEQFAARRASSSLSALARRMPNVAHRKDGERLRDVSLDDVQVGDILVVFPHELAPADGVVIAGQGWMDESYLSGEPYQMPKVPGAPVLSGAINGNSALTVETGRLPIDSRYARIMRVMQQAEATRPRLRRLGDTLGAWYTPAALLIGMLGWIVSGSPVRFLAVVVIATPCPLLIAIPVAIIGAISLAARRGIIIKNPAMLERIDRCRTVIFDKTGTLTYGKPVLTAIEPAPHAKPNDVLSLAASLEQYSKHPLGTAILAAAKTAGAPLLPALEITEVPGRGMQGLVGGRRVELTGRDILMRIRSSLVTQLPPVGEGLESIVCLDGAYAAILRFRDEPREESRSLIAHFTPRHGVGTIMLLSGDRDSEVRYLAGRVGVREMRAGVSPEEKVDIVRQHAAVAPTLFIGDGINDAPAMQAATVGLAFGQTNEITAEAADAVILESNLGKVDEAIHIGRRMRAIALQSALGGMALSMAGMLLAVFGYLPPLTGALAQEAIDVLAVVNALRVGVTRGRLADFDV